jgi:hypothetical protein
LRFLLAVAHGEAGGTAPASSLVAGTAGIRLIVRLTGAIGYFNPIATRRLTAKRAARLRYKRTGRRAGMCWLAEWTRLAARSEIQAIRQNGG